MSRSVGALLRHRAAAAQLCALAAVYYLAARLGLLVQFEHSHVTPMWLPSGIALAALLLGGYRLWPAIAVAAFAGNFTTGLPVWVSAGVAFGSTLEALCGAALLRQVGLRHSFDRIRDVTALAVLGAIVSPLVGAAIGSLSLRLGGVVDGADLQTVWGVWWVGDGMGVFVATPAILLWSQCRRGSVWQGASTAEAALQLGVITAAALVVFLHGFDYPYLVFPLAFLAAVRLGLRGATAATLAVSVFAVWGTAHMTGPFAAGDPTQRLLDLQLYLGALQLTGLTLAAAVASSRAAQRREAVQGAELARAEQLRRDEERLRSLVDNAPIGISIADSQGRLISANRAYQELVGYSAAELLGMPIAGFTHPDDNGPDLRLMADLVAGRRSHGKVEKRWVRKDGEVRWVRVNASCLAGPDGESRVVAIVEDITERRRAAEAVRESEAQFRLLAENSTDMVCRHAPDGRFLYVSPAVRSMLGYEPEELVGRSPYDGFMHPDDEQQARQGYATALARPDTQVITTRARTRSGDWEWLESTVRAVREAPTSVVVELHSTSRLVSERKRSEEELLRSEARLRSMIDTSLNAVISMDLWGRITRWSAQAEQTFGWACDEVVGRPLSEVIVPERYREAHERGLERFRRNGETLVVGSVIEMSALHRDGHEIPVEIAISAPTSGAAGLEFTAFLRDISERVRAERLRAMQFAVTRTLSEASSLAEAAPRILEGMAQALDWQAGLVFLVDPQTRRLRLQHGWQHPSVTGRVAEAFETASFGYGEGLPGHVWRAARPISVPDVTSDPRVLHRHSALKAGFRGGAGLPIVHEGRVSGVVTFGSLEPRQLDDELIAVFADIGSQIGQFVERKRVEAALADSAARLSALAATDSLTGLPNRREFERQLALPRPRRFAVLAIDVDNLKTLNDAYGHEAGDAALRAIGAALRMGVREGDVVARIGGDEFAALFPGADVHEAAAAAERLRRSLHGTALPHGQARISIGCAPGTALDDPLRVWAAADDALYRAKRAGRDRFELAVDDDDPTTSPSARVARWESLLPSLISTGGMVAVYQPIVELGSREAVAFEALGRPADGPADAGVDSLFSAADRLGMGRDLDWVCRRAALHDSHALPPGHALFINVGATSLLDPIHDVDQMLLLLRWARRRPQEVVLEITEREGVRDLERLAEVVSLYRAHGFRFALDDVGEGHSTFEVLAAATPEFIKVAGSLTRRADLVGPRAAIEALVTFAVTTGAHVIAEGVESEACAADLSALGVTLGQGFALARPAAARVWRRGVRRALAASSEDAELALG